MIDEHWALLGTAAINFVGWLLAWFHWLGKTDARESAEVCLAERDAILARCVEEGKARRKAEDQLERLLDDTTPREVQA